MNDIPLLKILNYFIENPYGEVYLRELAKKLKLSPFSIKKYVDLFIEEDLVIEEKRANLRYFKANINNFVFKYIKITTNLYTIQKAGLLEFLREKITNLSSITLFGSIARGEDDGKSDIDLIVIGKTKYLNLSEIEGKLGRDIRPHIYSWGEWNKKSKQDSPFYFEVITHGIPLYGELPIVKWK